MPGSGHLGLAFEDPVVTSDLTEIRVRCGSRVDNVRCIYANGAQSASHGGNGGREEIFYLARGIVLLKILFEMRN